jgi:hypothetical protein
MDCVALLAGLSSRVEKPATIVKSGVDTPSRRAAQGDPFTHIQALMLSRSGASAFGAEPTIMQVKPLNLDSYFVFIPISAPLSRSLLASVSAFFDFRSNSNLATSEISAAGKLLDGQIQTVPKHCRCPVGFSEEDCRRVEVRHFRSDGKPNWHLLCVSRVTCSPVGHQGKCLQRLKTVCEKLYRKISGGFLSSRGSCF